MKQGKKASGGKYKKPRKKKLFEMAGQKNNVKLGDEKRKTKATRGKNKKSFLLQGKIVNVTDGKKITKQEIKNVFQTPSNRFLARQNIITKGAIVETASGKVRITNRPTKEGNLNGVMVKE